MTTVRKDGPTPAGGDWTLATYVVLETMEETSEELATGIVISEYTQDGALIRETVGGIDRAGAAAGLAAA